MSTIISIPVITLALSTTLLAQSELQVYRGTLAAADPAPGNVALLPDTMVFLDDERPEASFFFPRANVQDLTVDAETVTVQLRNPVRDRAGSTNRVILRLAAPGEAAALQRWFGEEGPAVQPALGAGVLTFSAQRKKRFRSNTDGKLIIDDQRLIFESTDNATDSRRWDLKDIRELKHSNPYELEIRPFHGDRYTLSLSGSGMDNAQFREIVDRVTRARTDR